ncbi:M16 family metallopeptidase [Amycolatopsis lurida]
MTHQTTVRTTLPNGLRVLLVPDHTVPVAGVSVHYDVGFRSEPRGFSGFAHLFEHLMFQGSESLPKLEHSRRIQASGGKFNGSTHPDYTDYYSVLPSSALRLALFCEADRMRAPLITEENLRNQVDVVKEEIRLNVHNRPYGGFPWIHLPPLLYDSFANSHNGYGDFVDLERATVDDCAAFFDTYYAPGNAVLTVAGDLDVEQTLELIALYFGDVPARDAAPRQSLAEPPLRAERRGEHVDPNAPLPGLALGYRLPDPATETPSYVAHVVLSLLLADGHSSRLVRRLLQQESLAVDVSAGCGLLGRPFNARNPDTFLVTAIHPSGVESESVLTAVEEELATLAAHGPTREELTGVAARLAASLHRERDQLLGRTLSFGVAELLFGQVDMISDLPERVAAIGIEDVATAAKALCHAGRAILVVRQGAVGSGDAT